MAHIHPFDWLVSPIGAGGQLDSTVHVETGDSTAAIVLATRAAGVVEAIRKPAELAGWDARDLVALLDHAGRMRAAITYAEDVAILHGREAGASWSDLAGALGIPVRTMRDRYESIRLARASYGADAPTGPDSE